MTNPFSLLIIRYHCQNPRNCSTTSNQVGEGPSGETIGRTIATVPTDEVDHPYSTANWIRAQHEDDNIRFIVKKIKLRTEISELERRNAGPVLKTFIENFNNLFLNSKGILSIHEDRKTDVGAASRHQLAVVPEAWYERVMKTAHEISGHFAAENTLERARQKLWFPRMRLWAEEVVNTCPQCVMKSKHPKPQRHTLVSGQECESGFPFQKISIDTVGPVPKSTAGHEYMLTVRCEFSKWIEIYPIRRQNVETILRCLLDDFIPRYGCPSELCSDRGSAFASQAVQQVAERLKIHWRLSTPYHPQTQGVERMHRDLIKSLRAFVGLHPKTWDRCLPGVIMALRTTKSATTGKTPAFLVFGHELEYPLDIAFGSPSDYEEVYSSAAEYSKELQERLRAGYSFARKNMKKAVHRQRQNYYKKQTLFRPGDRVWLFSPRTGTGPRKFAVYWTGPWTVVRAFNNVTFELAPSANWQRTEHVKAAIDRLRPFLTADGEPEQCIAPLPTQNLDFSGDEYAEIVEHIEDSDSEDESESVEQPTTRAPIADVDTDVNDSGGGNVVPTATPQIPQRPVAAPPPATPITVRPPPKARASNTQRLLSEAQSFVGDMPRSRTRHSAQASQPSSSS